ncbi:hypothetical protein AB0K52_22470 [Glycomyces sp. NPDC049804]|uniref:hypothetical protein n=1 Tax=Glycomyces sp. NPDC049804 TaxID=3154363 RepID=UPI00342D81F8
MTDTAAAQLTPALCEVAELQYGMITHVQAAAAGVEDLPAALVRSGLAETITDDVIRLKAGAHHPHPEVYAAWLTLPVAGGVTAAERDTQADGIASHSTALVLWGLTAPYGPVWEFSVWNRYPMTDEERELGGNSTLVEPDEPRIHWRARLPTWTTVDGIPTTTPAQTLFDLANRLDTDQLQDLAARFVTEHHFNPVHLREDLLKRCLDQADADGEFSEEDQGDRTIDRRRPWNVPGPRGHNALEWTNRVAADLPERW